MVTCSRTSSVRARAGIARKIARMVARVEVGRRGNQRLARAIFHNEKESHSGKIKSICVGFGRAAGCNGAPAYFGRPTARGSRRERGMVSASRRSHGTDIRERRDGPRWEDGWNDAGTSACTRIHVYIRGMRDCDRWTFYSVLVALLKSLLIPEKCLFILRCESFLRSFE